MTWFARRKVRQEAIDAEAIALLAEASETHPSEHYAAYSQARALMRLSRSKNDAELERFYAKIAVKIAAVVGRRIGPKDYLESRDIPPTLKIENGRLIRTMYARKGWQRASPNSRCIADAGGLKDRSSVRSL